MGFPECRNADEARCPSFACNDSHQGLSRGIKLSAHHIHQAAYKQGNKVGTSCLLNLESLYILSKLSRPDGARILKDVSSSVHYPSLEEEVRTAWGCSSLWQLGPTRKQLQGFVEVMTVPHLEAHGTTLGTQVSDFFFNTFLSNQSG